MVTRSQVPFADHDMTSKVVAMPSYTPVLHGSVTMTMRAGADLRWQGRAGEVPQALDHAPAHLLRSASVYACLPVASWRGPPLCVTSALGGWDRCD